MTWGEWVNSEYNTLDFFIDGGLVCGNGMWIGYYIVGVTPSDIILNNGAYTLTYISLEGN